MKKALTRFKKSLLDKTVAAEKAYKERPYNSSTEEIFSTYFDLFVELIKHEIDDEMRFSDHFEDLLNDDDDDEECGLPFQTVVEEDEEEEEDE